MKNYIRRHEINGTFEKHYKSFFVSIEGIEKYQKTLKYVDSQWNIAGTANDMALKMCNSLYLNEIKWGVSILSICVELGKIVYDMLNHKGQEVEVCFAGESVLTTGRVFEEAQQTTSWVNTLHVAIIARHQPTIKTLCAVANDDLVTNHSRNTFTEVNFFKALLDNQGNPREFLAAIFKEDSMYFDEPSGFEMSKLHNGFKNKYVDRYYYQLSKANFEYWGYEAVLNKDKERFNELLLISLQMHKAVWDTVELGYTNLDYRNNALGWVSLPLLALCSFAFDNGIEIEVGSDYIPEWLYKGEFERWG